MKFFIQFVILFLVLCLWLIPNLSTKKTIPVLITDKEIEQSSINLKEHYHPIPDLEGIAPPSKEDLEEIRRSIPEGIFRDRFLAIDKEAQERVLNKIWYSPAIANNFDSIRVGPQGELHYVCKGLCGQKLNITTNNSDEVVVKTTYSQSVPISSPPILNSRPGSQNIIYLDFNGMIVSNTYWNNDPDYNISSWDTRPYSRDSDETTFSPIEQQYIEDIWRGVAADFESFDVNVTTVDPYPNPYFYHALITKGLDKNNQVTPASGVGGIAVLGTPYYSLQNFSPENVRYYSPAWINGQSWFSAEDIALICSHELGHNLGLNHDGNNSVEYYSGHGGDVTWGPIMGTAYDKNIRSWSRGEYYAANNIQEDDLSIIGYQFSSLSDQEGNYLSPVIIQPGDSGNISYDGIIQNRDDIDVFQIDMPLSGRLQLSAYPTTNNYYGLSYENWGSSLNLQIRILDVSGTLIVSNQIINRLHAEVDLTLPAGSYYIEVDGVDSGSPLDSSPSGFSDYASMGNFYLSGSIPSDLDLDGMPDSWEIAQFGSIDAMPDIDFDGDGSDNLTEYIAGTDPIDASSVFFVSGFDLRSSERIVSWDSVAGRSYQVLLSTDLEFDSFLPISSSLSYPINRYTDTVERTDAQLFYKIKVSQP